MPRAADGVQHGIRATCGGVADALDKVLGAVVDRRGAERRHELVVVLGRRAVHLQSGQPSELEQRAPCASRRAVDEDALAAAHLGGSVQHHVRGEIVHHHADGLGRIQARGDGHQLLRGPAYKFGVATGITEGEAGNLLARLDG